MVSEKKDKEFRCQPDSKQAWQGALHPPAQACALLIPPDVLLSHLVTLLLVSLRKSEQAEESNCALPPPNLPGSRHLCLLLCPSSRTCDGLSPPS